MEKFTTHTGRALPLRRSNVDTDQIIPAVYLKRITRTGFEDGLFAAWRADPEFILNQEQYQDVSVLVAGPDFGTGSSREHAVWALKDYGFKVVLSARFADIFRGNSAKDGLLTAVLKQEDIEILWKLVEENPELEVTVDLQAREVRVEGHVFTFEVDDYTRWRLLEGLDDISLTLRHAEEIDVFEEERPGFKPKTLPAAV
ncbi:3-isopropylmalate dehydratase, small subunit [Catenulispora acidiphila DSM 44928]|uniref:3-isopropylmalate dehydratase small subunit n=1 Tax=Catenulispora acidiphila (strain DSM 44928 / JCM 14897 / NBRC 102108 / NRRL B-24433 / ID139908) TaxID=479433 RepID=C7QH21_CATAD|nr:3-isopropylmalate dehydratase small subunit [Catenulispora acidiphila]ACU76871.1 3-isopropylmalate dehydratase, small subunit [Catenulispora acidiphila DSM 44928]